MSMHDCVKTRERLVDLVFDELTPEARRRALLELEGCRDCLAQYQSMIETLRVFDQAVETAMPEEGYWPGYEARLRERLRHERPSWKRRLADWIGGFRLLTARPPQLVAGLALVLLAIGWWAWQRRQAVAPSPVTPDIVHKTPTPQPKPESRDKDIAKEEPRDNIPNKRGSAHLTAAKSSGQAPRVRREERDGEIVENVVVSRGYDQPLIAASLFTPET